MMYVIFRRRGAAFTLIISHDKFIWLRAHVCEHFVAPLQTAVLSTNKATAAPSAARQRCTTGTRKLFPALLWRRLVSGDCH